jgi:superfamily II DNA or RNA helicase
MAADIANWSVLNAHRQTLIQISEFKQFLMLKTFLKCPYSFVHGGVSTATKRLVPQEYWDIDRDQIIKDFNTGKVPCLVGTSAISVGTDLKPTGCNIYLQGGVSEIKVRQAIGRGTRICPEMGKTDCLNFDFKVMGSSVLERHCDARRDLYDSMGKVVVHGGRR